MHNNCRCPLGHTLELPRRFRPTSISFHRIYIDVSHVVLLPVPRPHAPLPHHRRHGTHSADEQTRDLRCMAWWHTSWAGARNRTEGLAGQACANKGRAQLEGYPDYFELDIVHLPSFDFQRDKGSGVECVLLGDLVLLEDTVKGETYRPCVPNPSARKTTARYLLQLASPCAGARSHEPLDHTQSNRDDAKGGVHEHRGVALKATSLENPQCTPLFLQGDNNAFTEIAYAFFARQFAEVVWVAFEKCVNRRRLTRSHRPRPYRQQGLGAGGADTLSLARVRIHLTAIIIFICCCQVLQE